MNKDGPEKNFFATPRLINESSFFCLYTPSKIPLKNLDRLLTHLSQRHMIARRNSYSNDPLCEGVFSGLTVSAVVQVCGRPWLCMGARVKYK